MRMVLAAMVVAVVLMAACGGGGGSSGGGSGSSGGGGGASCTPAKTPPNLMANAGFECGADGGTDRPDGWAARDGTMAWVGEGRSGKALQLTVPASGQGTLLYRYDVASGLGTRTYCATLWAKGTAPDVKLIMRRVNQGGSVTDFTFSDTVGPAFARVPPNLVREVPGENADRLLMLVQTITAKAGDTVAIDDVDVWVSDDGLCKEAR